MQSLDTVKCRFPVGGMVSYRGSSTVRLLRHVQHDFSQTTETYHETRGKIRELSKSSLQRLTFLADTTQTRFASLLTLTYLEPPATGDVAKRHLKSTLEWFKRKYGGQVSYIWFMEFQARGAVHFHVLLSKKRTKILHEKMAKHWVKTTRQGDGEYSRLRDRKLFHVKQSVYRVFMHDSTWQDLRSESGARGYVAKYATKQEQKNPPEWFNLTGRFWGASRDVRDSVEPVVLKVVSEIELREYLTLLNDPRAKWDVLPKYLFGIAEDGKIKQGLNGKEFPAQKGF